MVKGADKMKDALLAENEVEGPMFKMKDDPRVTRIGHFIRRHSIDEFPQFLNVLVGDMSVVGPRPPLPREVAQYDEWAMQRLAVKPGLTGPWEVGGRSDVDFDDTARSGPGLHRAPVGHHGSQDHPPDDCGRLHRERSGVDARPV